VVIVMEIVLYSEVQKQPDVAVGHPVEHFPTLFTGSHQPGETELAQLVARGRLGGPHDTGKIAHAELATHDQGIDHAETPWIGQQLESLREDLRRALVEQVLGRGAMPVLVGH
jgi:hypothetical protein